MLRSNKLQRCYSGSATDKLQLKVLKGHLQFIQKPESVLHVL